MRHSGPRLCALSEKPIFVHKASFDMFKNEEVDLESESSGQEGFTIVTPDQAHGFGSGTPSKRQKTRLRQSGRPASQLTAMTMWLDHLAIPVRRWPAGWLMVRAQCALDRRLATSACPRSIMRRVAAPAEATLPPACLAALLQAKSSRLEVWARI